MASGSREKTVEFAVQQLRKNPSLTMSELKALAEPKGFKIYPLIMGLAYKDLGTPRSGPGKVEAPVASKKRASKKSRGEVRAEPTRGPGRPARAASETSGGGDLKSQLEQVFAHMHDLENENRHLRGVVAQMRDLLDSAAS